MTRPSLIVASQTSIDFWESEIEFWTGDCAGVIMYTGVNAARAVIADHELWLHPSSMDGRTAASNPLRHKVTLPPAATALDYVEGYS